MRDSFVIAKTEWCVPFIVHSNQSEFVRISFSLLLSSETAFGSTLIEKASKILKVTEFVTASELASMMDVSTTEIISACMTLGIMVTMNQRLDAETLSIVAEEFGFQVEFVTADIEETIENVNSSSSEMDANLFDSDGFNKRLDKVYEKFSDNLVRKIRQASNNGKDEKAISIINQIFLDD